MTRKPDKSMKGASLRAEADARLQTTKGEVAAMPVTDVQQLVHELQVHQIELEMQNDELRRTQRELEAARDRYVDLYDFSPIAHLTLDTSGTIVEVNVRATMLLGIDRQDLIGQRLSRFFASEDQDIFRRHRQDVLKTGTRQTREIRLRNKAGATSWVHLESLVIHDTPGPITHWRTALLDITEPKRTEAALRVSEERYRTLYDETPTMYFTLAMDGTVRSVNRFGAEQLGYRVEELIGHSILDLFHECDKEAIVSSLSECLATPEKTRNWEFRKVRKDGRIIWVMETLRVSQSLTGETVILITCEDTTERKRTEEMRARLAAIIESSDDAIISEDLNGFITTWNQGAQRLFDYTEQDVIGRSISILIPPDREDEERRILERITRGESTDHYETVRRHRDGSQVDVSLTVSPIKDAHGQVIGASKIARDITEQKRAREERRRSRAFITSVVENLPNMIFVKDAKNLKYIRFNKAGEDLLGYSREDLIGKSDYDFFPKAEADFFTETDRQVLKAGRLHDIPEESIQTRDKGQRILHTKKIPLLDADGTPQYLLGISEDITERKRLEAQFRQGQKMEAVGQLAGGVAHDFNNLLTVINGYGALLLDQLPPEDSRHMMAAETLRAGKRAGELTKQLLAFSRKQVLLLQPLNLNDSLQSVSSMLSRLLGEEVTLAMDLAPDLWSINGDTGQLNQVTMNLAINARDAMPRGGTVAIATRNVSVTPERPYRHRMMPPGDYVHVSVRDTGHGMSPETISHLFEPFFTTKEVGQGSGLGLATVYGIVKQSQGYIFVDSAVNQGATFHFYYPRVMAAPAVAETPSVPRRRGSETLLVVEDQDMVRTFVAQALNSYGYRVIEAASGEEALRIAAALPEPVQALVTDVIMPQMSGPMLAQQLRLVWPGLRVLFISGYTDRTEPVTLNEPGAAFIQKPFLPDALARQLRDLLDKSI